MHSCLTDTSFKMPVLWPHQPTVEAVVIGPFGIVCLRAGVYVQFKKIFGHFYLHFWLVWVLVLAIAHLNVVDSLVLNYCREGLDLTMNKLLDWDGGDIWAQFLGTAWISIITKTTHILDCLESWDHNPFFVSST